MPIDLVIDEREGGSTPGSATGNGSKDGLGGSDAKCNADSSSHDGASTPDLVRQQKLVFISFKLSNI